MHPNVLKAEAAVICDCHNFEVFKEIGKEAGFVPLDEKSRHPKLQHPAYSVTISFDRRDPVANREAVNSLRTIVRDLTTLDEHFKTLWDRLKKQPGVDVKPLPKKQRAKPYGSQYAVTYTNPISGKVLSGRIGFFKGGKIDAQSLTALRQKIFESDQRAIENDEELEMKAGLYLGRQGNRTSVRHYLLPEIDFPIFRIEDLTQPKDFSVDLSGDTQALQTTLEQNLLNEERWAGIKEALIKAYDTFNEINKESESLAEKYRAISGQPKFVSTVKEEGTRGRGTVLTVIISHPLFEKAQRFICIEYDKGATLVDPVSFKNTVKAMEKAHTQWALGVRPKKSTPPQGQLAPVTGEEIMAQLIRSQMVSDRKP